MVFAEHSNFTPFCFTALSTFRRADTYAEPISLVVILWWLTRDGDKANAGSNLNLEGIDDNATPQCSLSANTVYDPLWNSRTQSFSQRKIPMPRKKWR